MGKLIFGARGGLGDRLFNMAYGLRLARLLKREPILWWPKTNTCKARFEELFVIPKYFRIVHLDEDKLPLEAVNLYINKDNSKKEKGRDFYCLDLNENLKTILIKLTSAYYSAQEKKSLNKKIYRKKIEEEISSYIRKLKPIKKLREKIKSFKKNFDKNTVSIHLRRTDFPEWLSSSMPTNKEIIKMLKKHLQKNPRIKFFLATDSKETESKLKKELKDKIITYPKKYWVKKRDKNRMWEGNIYRSKDSVKNSLIELYLLSKNKKVIRFGGNHGKFNRLSLILNPNQKIIILKNKRNLLDRLMIQIKRLNFIFKKCFRKLDYWIGAIGIFLKKHHPELYFKLKKLKNER